MVKRRCIYTRFVRIYSCSNYGSGIAGALESLKKMHYVSHQEFITDTGRDNLVSNLCPADVVA